MSIECSICFRALEETEFFRLSTCSHEFCKDCLQKFANSQAAAKLMCCCPVCHSQVVPHDLELLTNPETMQAILDCRLGLEQQAGPNPAEVFNAEQAFVRLARARHFRKCTFCQSPVEKNGGCNNVACHCGKTFQWNTAPVMFPCSEIRFVSPKSQRFKILKLFGSRCPECPPTPAGTAKLVAYRAAITPVMLPALALCACGVLVALPLILGAVVHRRIRECLRPARPYLPVNAHATLKLVVVGNHGIGKSSLLTYRNAGSVPEWVPDVVENQIINLQINSRFVALSLWDITTNEDYERLRPLNYPQTDVFLLCFSVDNPQSLEQLENRWITEVQLHCPTAGLLLVGLKSDLRADPSTRPEQIVTQQQAEEFAQRHGIEYAECSSVMGEGVNQIFDIAGSLALRSQFRLELKSCWQRIASTIRKSKQ